MANDAQTTEFDCIVIGFGGMGSAALREAAKKGWSVLGIDRHGPAHDQGSSHGQTRIIRRAYYEHPSYVPLADRAFAMWDELNKRHRTSIDVKELITKVGLLQIGRPESDVIKGVMQSVKRHELNVEQFTPQQIQQRLPLFNVPDGHIGIFEPDAAFLRVELCVAAMVNQAIKFGAQIRSGVSVVDWKPQTDGSIRVQTNSGPLLTRRLIVTAGAWSATMLPKLNLPIQVVQKQQQWFQLDRVDQRVENDFPCFLFEHGPDRWFYGFPEIDYLGMKVCEHTGGTPLESADRINRLLNQVELGHTEDFMKDNFNFGRSRLVHHSTCMYTVSDDGHFFVDRYPGQPNVVFAAGMSGHGFKFAPVIGKHLVKLLDGASDPDFEFLRIGNRI